MRSPEEIAWVAGLLEGEGCFGLRAGERAKYPRVTCAMTDADVLSKLNSIYPGSVKPRRVRGNRKPCWVWDLSMREDLVVLLNDIRPHMGDRRGAKIDEIFDIIKGNPLRSEIPLVCGTGRAFRAGCRCEACREADRAYHRQWRQKNIDKVRKYSREWARKKREDSKDKD